MAAESYPLPALLTEFAEKSSTSGHLSAGQKREKHRRLRLDALCRTAMADSRRGEERRGEPPLGEEQEGVICFL